MYDAGGQAATNADDATPYTSRVPAAIILRRSTCPPAVRHAWCRGMSSGLLSLADDNDESGVEGFLARVRGFISAADDSRNPGLLR
uniref:Uncharacterized protein n=1 Tax=Mycena chlorophos TaxID=658473 RepID=A0ABQ0LFA3_MYCCL|nr:predicted protein [Mycena chlorophos]